MPRNLPPRESPEPNSTGYLARILLGLRADPLPYPPTDWTSAHPQNKRSKRRLQTPQKLILGFALLILIGTLLSVFKK